MSDRELSSSDSDIVDSSESDISGLEKAFMVLSTVFTIALFSFAMWQAFTGPGPATPTVGVNEERVAEDGAVIYTVELRNRGDVGLVTVTVEAGCTEPPTELRFESVPASGTREGTVLCPPGTRNPDLSVTTWVQE
jgi:hypothetical protein